jgi:hypothetical protein
MIVAKILPNRPFQRIAAKDAAPAKCQR